MTEKHGYILGPNFIHFGIFFSSDVFPLEEPLDGFLGDSAVDGCDGVCASKLGGAGRSSAWANIDSSRGAGTSVSVQALGKPIAHCSMTAAKRPRTVQLVLLEPEQEHRRRRELQVREREIAHVRVGYLELTLRRRLVLRIKTHPQCSIAGRDAERTGDVQSTNLTGFTSSRSELRTKAYTVRILSVERNVFSSWLRSLNLMRIVVCEAEQSPVRCERPVETDGTYRRPPCSLCFLLCLPHRLRAKRRIGQGLCSSR